MRHDAIYALYPQVITIDDTEGAFDKDGNRVEIDLVAVSAWQNPEQYKILRAAEYPDFRDYLDGVVKGDQNQIQTYIDACNAVKQKYPKP
jgi:hypothetical protein